MINVDDFLAQSGIARGSLEVWLEREWLLPERRATKMAFSDVDAARARLIRDLKADFGVNDEGVDVVLHLVDQLHGLRGALADLRAQGTITRRRESRRLRDGRKAGRLVRTRRCR